MTIVTVEVSGATAVASKTGPLTRGMVGVPVNLTFNETWKSLTKTIVFKAGNLILDQLYTGDQIVVPWEMLMSLQDLYIGVFGTNADGSLSIPTVWSYVGAVLPGADPSGDTSTDPSMPVYQQLQAQIDQLKQTGGSAGLTPYIGENGNWWLGEQDTGVSATGPRGEPGPAPHIGENGHWFIEDTDTGVEAQGPPGEPGGSSENTEQRLTTLETQMAELLYTAISISSFAHNAGTKEMGAIVTELTLSWTTNKKPTALTLDGASLNAELTSKKLSELLITKDKTWTLKATDERGAEASKTTTLSFQNGIYYGAKAVPQTVDSAFIMGLGKKELSGTKNRSVSVTGGDGLYFWYAYPKRLGKSLFNIGGFDYEYELITVEFTNSLGYTEDYYVYRSGQYAPASLSVTVKNGG